MVADGFRPLIPDREKKAIFGVGYLVAAVLRYQIHLIANFDCASFLGSGAKGIYPQLSRCREGTNGCRKLIRI